MDQNCNIMAESMKGSVIALEDHSHNGHPIIHIRYKYKTINVF